VFSTRFAATTILFAGVLIAAGAAPAQARRAATVRGYGAPCDSARSRRGPRCSQTPLYTIAQAAQTGEGEIASCQNTELAPSAGDLQLVREAVLCLINQERARDELQALRVNAQLQRSATEHSQDMIAEDYFGHYPPDGVGPAERAEQDGYISADSESWLIGENIAYGTAAGDEAQDTPQAIVEAWLASPEHLANILEARYTETGIGVYPAVPAAVSGGLPGATYTQDFGVVRGRP